MMYYSPLLTILGLNIIYTSTDAYNILAIFPTPSFSHQQSCLGVSRALAEKGHNVTVITTTPGQFEPLSNYHEIDVSILFDTWKEFQKNTGFTLQSPHKPFGFLPVLARIFAHILEVTTKTENVQQLLRSKDIKMDLIIYEGFYPAALGYVHHFNYPPSVVFYPIPKNIPTHYTMGNPINPSYISSYLTGYSDEMSFFEKLQNTIYIFYELYVDCYYTHPMQNTVMKKLFGENVPSTIDMEKNNSLMLLSGDLSQSYPIPLQPNTILVGTTHIRKQKPLPDDIKKWMDESEGGVIYFSLGSNMKGTSLPEEKRNAFAEAFERFPKFRVIWKWESDVDFPGKPKNVLLKKWLPQQTLFAHPKLRLFITQGGQQSRQEAIHYAVPTLTVPLFGDQGWNARQLEDIGYGLTLNFYDINQDTVYEKLKALLTNDSFKRNAMKLSELSKDKPMSNTDTVVWWMEYVIRHKGAPHLRPAVQNLHWFQYILLDVLAFLLLSLLLILFTIFYSFYYLIRKLCSTPSNRIKIKKH